MSAGRLKNAGAAHRGDGDAGMAARGRAAPGADDAARAAKARRTAWLLGGLAVFFYVGYIAWMFVRSGGA
jgi:hypothetical protein